MNDRSSNLLDNVTPTAQALPRRTTLGLRPAAPKQRLHASMSPQLRDIDWNGHVPTAPRGPVSMTRAQLDRALATDASDDDERWLPQLPGQRRPSDKPLLPGKRQPTDHVPAFDDNWGRPSAWAAFGDGAA